MTAPHDSVLCPCESGLHFTLCCGGEMVLSAVLNEEGVLSGERVTPPIAQAAATIATDPSLFPARIDFTERRMSLIKMSPRWYRESVFLDPARIRGRYVVDAAMAGLQRRIAGHAPHAAVFIFHTAFCGSTLMSQALDALYENLPLREPEALGSLLLMLRELHVDEQDKHHAYWMVIHLLARRYAEAQPAVIKANDYANPLMLEIIARDPSAPLLFMHVPLREFVVACLRLPSRREWIHQRYVVIHADAAQQFPNMDVEVSSDDAFAEIAAFYWAYNLAVYRLAYLRAPQRVRSLDFNVMLTAPLGAVTATARYFDLTPRVHADAELTMRELLTVYSKNKDYAYSPQQRQQDLRELEVTYAAEINRAEKFGRRLLGADYPDGELPGALA